jgi:hypothetical protein
MIYAIVRIYPSVAVATQAYDLLEQRGLTRQENKINLVTPTSAGTPEAIVAAIKAGLVPAAEAAVYAQAVARGNSLVSLVPPFGTDAIYSRLLDKLNPIDVGVRRTRRVLKWDDAAPFSSAIGFHAISPPSRYRFMGLPAIARSGRTLSEVLGLPELSNPHYSLFGTPRISSNPGPFSGLFKLPLLK